MTSSSYAEGTGTTATADSSSDDTGLIVGCVVGALVFIGALGAFIYYISTVSMMSVDAPASEIQMEVGQNSQVAGIVPMNKPPSYDEESCTRKD